MKRFHVALLAPLCWVLATLASAGESSPTTGPAPDAAMCAAIDRVFADFALDAHIPGLVYGVVAGGRLVHVHGLGVQDLASKRPVTPDSLFRIASMTKAFTALTVLKLRDEGQLRLDEPAETYVPEMRGWKSPTLDAPRIRVRDLLNHTAGFVTDDPWGDRQTPLAEPAFSRFLRDGVPFSSTPETAMEYSNLGYAILGRIITNVSGRPYADEIGRTLFESLGMTSTGFVAGAAPVERRAQGYRWQDNTWTLEETMGPGAFGAMGGVQTSATDYAHWVSHLLSAWPPRDDAETGPVRRATVRELAQGSNFPKLISPRPASPGLESCQRATAYGMGMYVTDDCEFGLVLSHAGGYPGYGSFVLLLPDQGVGLFAFTNRTYAVPTRPLYEAAAIMKNAGFLKDRPLPVSPDLARAYGAVRAIYERGDVGAGQGLLAMNFLIDRDAAGWAQDLARLKQQVGDCDTQAPVVARGVLAGAFTWRCATGRLSGRVLLAPTQPPGIQSLSLSVK
jgi:D-alanyl-D-alanine-carboxypeptidase/D-alanyl-D-alanine-endopeptidase